MVEAVDEMLVVQRGRELGYKLADDQFKTVVDNIKKENKLETEEQFQAALKSEGMTMEELRRILERNMIMQRVRQNEVLGKLSVTDDEARAYYDTHMNDFTTLPSVTLREILVSVNGTARGVSVATDEAAQAKAEAIRVRVTQGGESFEKVAATVSDSPSKANGGLIGPLSVNDISPELRQLVESMKPGDISTVIRTPRGYQVLKLETVTATQTMTLEQARDQIGEKIYNDKQKKEFDKYIEKLRTQAIIEWKNPDILKAFDEGVSSTGTVTNPDGIRDSGLGIRGTQAGDTSNHAVQVPNPKSQITTESRWYAIWTRSRHEQTVREQLERKQIDAFLPTMPRWSRWKDRKKKIDWPLCLRSAVSRISIWPIRCPC